MKISINCSLAQQTVTSCPTKSESWVMMSIASSKDVDKSLAFIEKALEIDPNSVYAYLTKGNIYLESGQIEDAIGVFRHASLLSRDISIYDGLVHSYLIINQTKEAFNLASTLFKSAPVPRTMGKIDFVKSSSFRIGSESLTRKTVRGNLSSST